MTSAPRARSLQDPAAHLPPYRCPGCHLTSPVEELSWCCPGCGGPWDLDFSAGAVPGAALPGRVDSLWRYAEALPLSSPATSLGEGRTPLVRLVPGISAKLDFLMPTLSFKDRGAVMLAELARVLRPGQVVADSSGNAGTAVAAYCARAGLACTVYVPGSTSAKKAEQIVAHGARLERVPGDREATAAAARVAADAPGTFYASHVYNPYFLHGTKTYVYELWEDLGGSLPGTLVVPVGNGTLLLGAALAVDELYGHGLIDRRPALVAVQAAAVSPLAAAFHAGAAELPDDGTGAGTGIGPRAGIGTGADGSDATGGFGGTGGTGGGTGGTGSGSSGTDGGSGGTTLAEGIAIPRPPRARAILAAVRESGGTFLTVTEEQIRSAQLDLASRGLFVESTAVACWAAVRELPEGTGVREGETVVPLCGAGLKTGLAPR
ncbi:pyridoxal-phosphate dependent enzyme [Streptomyces sp. NPDC004609]|uniref:pyridoxal-phosphate dependent enzyme n=1 Tax=Streptomyces sp. NPDC004609 TaxID=3364704 RepID=UPI0036A6C275